jgi:hypothetical protein
MNQDGPENLAVHRAIILVPLNDPKMNQGLASRPRWAQKPAKGLPCGYNRRNLASGGFYASSALA